MIPITLNARTIAKKAMRTEVIISRIGFIISNIFMNEESTDSSVVETSPNESFKGSRDDPKDDILDANV